jgi:hypothetical protein
MTPEESEALYEKLCIDQIAELDQNYIVVQAVYGHASFPADQKVLLLLRELVVKPLGAKTAESLRANIREELKAGGHSQAVFSLALLYV